MQDNASWTASARGKHKHNRHAVDTIGAALNKLAQGNLSFSIDQPFVPDFEGLQHTMNEALSQMRNTLGAVAQSTDQIDTGLGKSDRARSISPDANSRQRLSTRLLQRLMRSPSMSAMLQNVRRRPVGNRERQRRTFRQGGSKRSWRDVSDQEFLQPGLKHHRFYRRDCLPDQSLGAECRCLSCTRWRSR